MSALEPRPHTHGLPRREAPSNTYSGRWRWWYADIADYMIRNPGHKLQDIATHVGRAANTVSMIVNTDMFREYMSQRRARWTEDHDLAIRSRLTSVAEQGLDLILTQMKSKGEKIPMKDLTAVTTSALEGLGYGPKSGPSVVIDNSTNQTVALPHVTPQGLEEARAALRAMEANKSGSSIAPPATPRDLPAPGNAMEGAGLDDATPTSDVELVGERA